MCPNPAPAVNLRQAGRHRQRAGETGREYVRTLGGSLHGAPRVGGRIGERPSTPSLPFRSFAAGVALLETVHLHGEVAAVDLVDGAAFCGSWSVPGAARCGLWCWLRSTHGVGA